MVEDKLPPTTKQNVEIEQDETDDFSDLLEDAQVLSKDDDISSFVISIVEEYLQKRYNELDALLVQEYLQELTKEMSKSKGKLHKSSCWSNK